LLHAVAPRVVLRHARTRWPPLLYRLRVWAPAVAPAPPPCGGPAPGAHNMKGENRWLSRLWEHFDRAPRAYVFCGDPAVLGVDFFVMDRRRGEVVRDVLPASMRAHPGVGRRISFALVDAMAELPALPPPPSAPPAPAH